VIPPPALEPEPVPVLPPIEATTERHVSVTGSDANPGTADEPFATLHRAQAEVRRLNQLNRETNIVVQIHAGTYELANPLTFTAEDGGTARQSITYTAAPGATVILSGGRRISGWQRGAGELWQTQVPVGWTFRQLFVNGQRAVRARRPNVADRREAYRSFVVTDAQLAADRSRFTITLPPEALANIRDISSLELITFGAWEIMRKRVGALDPTTGLVTLQPPHRAGHPDIQPKRGVLGYFEGAVELLDQAGEWHLNATTSTLTYWPRSGEDLLTAEVVAPTLPGLVRLAGTAAQPVRNLHFTGLQFRYVDWPLSEQGYLGSQATFHATTEDYPRVHRLIDAAVEWEFAQNCSLRGSVIEGVGGTGLALRKGCQDNLIHGNRIANIGATGINIGEAGDPEIDRAAVKDNVIEHNRIVATGLDYFGAVGVWIGITDGTVLAHNEITSTSYTGVSVGWRWNHRPSGCRNNRIEFNTVHDVMKVHRTVGVMGDGGSIYTLGLQPGTVVRGNYIANANQRGFYFDQGSRGYRMISNLVVGLTDPVYYNTTRYEDFTWENDFSTLPPRAPGRHGLALDADGRSTFLLVPHRPELEPESLTVAAWIKPRESSDIGFIIAKNPTENEVGFYGLALRRGVLTGWLNPTGGSAGKITVENPAQAVPRDEWCHVALTFDGKSLALFLNGAPVATASVPAARKRGGGLLNIGRKPSGSSYFNGLIDDASLYNRALTAAEIAALSAGNSGSDSLIARWTFDDLPDLEALRQRISADAGPQSQAP
jgi:hypothetical protein